MELSLERIRTLVATLREAGAIVLGKTNLSEWANFRSEHASSGWSGLGDQTRNGFAHALPISLTFFSRAWSESLLIRLAYAFERATHHRHPPTFLATLPA